MGAIARPRLRAVSRGLPPKMLWGYVVSRVADIVFVHWKRHRKRNVASIP